MTTTDIGAMTWTDLTVDDAQQISAFYSKVVGWQAEGVDMDGYQDFNMNRPDSGECVVGICHARGPNSDLPAAWMVYITIEDLDASLSECRNLGGEVVAGPKTMGSSGRYAVIRDPAGAVAALFEPA